MDLDNLPTVKRILSRIKVDAHEVTCQGAVVSGIAEAKQSLARSRNDYACLQATHGWEETNERTLIFVGSF
jgi:hypothetical protein